MKEWNIKLKRRKKTLNIKIKGERKKRNKVMQKGRRDKM